MTDRPSHTHQEHGGRYTLLGEHAGGGTLEGPNHDVTHFCAMSGLCLGRRKIPKGWKNPIKVKVKYGAF